MQLKLSQTVQTSDFDFRFHSNQTVKVLETGQFVAFGGQRSAILLLLL